MRKNSKYHYDYVVVGAGSAGCVIASRLAESLSASVLLLEAGGSDNRLSIRMPSAFYMPLNDSRINWGFFSEPESGLNNRRIHCPRGKVLGGSSSINGMVYVRGNKEDFNSWEKLGAAGWNYENVLPYFKKSQTADERREPHPYQGHEGPLATTTGKMVNPLYNIFVEAAVSAGYPRNHDINGADQEGFGPMPMTVDSGRRASTYQSFIKKRALKNLTVLRGATAEKIILEHGKAVGVSYVRKNILSSVRANSEVILCAGAISSPQILMLSGIGAADELAHHDIKTLAHLPGVGKNLMDHLEVYVQQSCAQPISLHKHLNLVRKARIGLEWLLFSNGLGTTNHFEVGGFINSEVNNDYPDIQFHFLPVAMSYDGKNQASRHGFQVHTGPMLSKSRGSVTLKDSNFRTAPKIHFNYMSGEDDFPVFRKAIRTARKIFRQSEFDPYRDIEISPGEHIESDADLDAFIRENAESAYHPCGTCRMGADSDSVVDPAGKVHGVDNLRVADASIFPNITNGNLNAPTIMVAERIAEFINAEQK